MKIVWHMPTFMQRTCGLSGRAIRLASELRTRGHQIHFVVDSLKTDFVDSTAGDFPVTRFTTQFRQPFHWSLQSRSKQQSANDLVAQLSLPHDLFISCQPESIIAYKHRNPAHPALFVCGGSVLLHEHAQRTRVPARQIIARQLINLDLFLKRHTEQAAMRAADAVVHDSRNTRETALDRYKLDPNKSHAIRGGVDPEQFVPPSDSQRLTARSRLDVGAEETLVVWTGRFSPEKNIPLLLDAMAECRGRSIKLFLVGSGPQEQDLIAKSQSLQLQSTVTFAGEFSDVREYLFAADIFAFPSQGESFGGSLVEAMACGVAPIALRPNGASVVNASEEIIEDSVTGILVPSSPSDFANALLNLAGDRELCLEMGQRASDHVRKSFTWRSAGDALNRLIHSIRSSSELESSELCRLSASSAATGCNR